jgi:hypothetical protein
MVNTRNEGNEMLKFFAKRRFNVIDASAFVIATMFLLDNSILGWGITIFAGFLVSIIAESRADA